MSKSPQLKTRSDMEDLGSVIIVFDNNTADITFDYTVKNLPGLASVISKLISGELNEKIKTALISGDNEYGTYAWALIEDNANSDAIHPLDVTKIIMED